MRIDVAYRPLRLGWAIRAGDFNAFRRAVRWSYALWGGRFNPILIVDDLDEAAGVVESFRVDVVWPIGEGDELTAFTDKFPYLINPFLTKEIFISGARAPARPYSQVLDVHNALAHYSTRPEWSTLVERGVRLYSWEDDDPLADVFLVQLGAYPDPTERNLSTRMRQWVRKFTVVSASSVTDAAAA
jgi:hypothetical protein